jgi:glycosyltransferase involved in cell wall biosynthesis
MRILIALTYYRPHTSGLTIYTERLAQALAKRGHQVTVLTSQYEKNLPLEETCDGVRVVRFPVLFRVSKGVISTSIGRLATRLAREHDVIHLHLPQFDAAGIALRGRLFGKPSMITYHCDLQLPRGIFNLAVNQVVNLMNNLAAIFTNRVITYTQDYADHSPFTSRFKHKTGIIQPPVVLPVVVKGAAEEFSKEHRLAEIGPVIGMAARFASEKGVEVLLDAMPRILSEFPKAVVLFAGQYLDVLGEDKYAARLFPRINQYIQEGHWQWLGVLNQTQMAAFYPNLDVITVPSLNSTESFGLVQIEAMMNNVPVVASNLPGVRQPVKMTGMGEIFQIGDSVDLGEQICKVLRNKSDYHVDHNWLVNHFAPDTVAQVYETQFLELLGQPATAGR